MILPDVNVLVYAFRADTPHHSSCARWLQSIIDRRQGIALCDAVVFGFLRIVTHQKIMSPPTPIDKALDFVRWLSEYPEVHWLASSRATLQAFDEITMQDLGVRGNLVPDAHLAALCIAHGATIATHNRDFARFEGLRRLDPLRIS